MRKLKPALTLGLVASLLTACAGSGGDVQPSVPAGSPATTEDTVELDPPGKIPAECQALLDKSQEWGFRPGQAWHPDSAAQAMEVARFFGTFHLVPKRSSDFFRNFLSSPPPVDEAAATKIDDRMGRAQICDTSLATQFLTGLVNYNWGPDKAAARSELFQFTLNQQALTMPAVPRVAALELYRAALAKDLSPGSPAEVKRLLAEWTKFRVRLQVAPANTALERTRTAREELQFTERLREGLSRSLPLP